MCIVSQTPCETLQGIFICSNTRMAGFYMQVPLLQTFHLFQGLDLTACSLAKTPYIAQINITIASIKRKNLMWFQRITHEGVNSTMITHQQKHRPIAKHGFAVATHQLWNC